MTKKHPNNGPTFTRAAVEKSRPMPPSPAKLQRAEDDAARDAARARALDHELKTDSSAFIQRIVARRKKLHGE